MNYKIISRRTGNGTSNTIEIGSVSWILSYGRLKMGLSNVISLKMSVFYMQFIQSILLSAQTNHPLRVQFLQNILICRKIT